MGVANGSRLGLVGDDVDGPSCADWRSMGVCLGGGMDEGQHRASRVTKQILLVHVRLLFHPRPLSTPTLLLEVKIHLLVCYSNHSSDPFSYCHHLRFFPLLLLPIVYLQHRLVEAPQSVFRVLSPSACQLSPANVLCATISTHRYCPATHHSFPIHPFVFNYI
jgi:hypothetical protein